MRRSASSCLVVACLLGRAPVAWACSYAAPAPHEVDPAAVAVDQVPPALPPLSVAEIRRGRAFDQGLCGVSGSSCDDIGTIGIDTQASDDRTAAERLGYRFTLVEGRLPSGLALPDGAVRPVSSGERFWFHWGDGMTDDQEAFAFTLEVVAIDDAGNESAPQTLRIADGGSGGCRIAGRSRSPVPGAALPVSLVVVGLARRRRRA